MRFQHEHREKPRIDFFAVQTPSWETFETVTLGVRIAGTPTVIEADVPVEKAREFAAEIERACRIVERDC